MSRPFTYNDENFTVIGNLLFVHFRDSKEHKAGEPALEIPPAIFSRMVTYSNVAIESTRAFSFGGGDIGFEVVKVNGKHYFAFTKNLGPVNNVRYYYCYYLLKDI